VSTEVFTVMWSRILLFWDVALHRHSWCFKSACQLHVQTVKLGEECILHAPSSYETLGPSYPVMQHHISADQTCEPFLLKADNLLRKQEISFDLVQYDSTIWQSVYVICTVHYLDCIKSCSDKCTLYYLLFNTVYIKNSPARFEPCHSSSSGTRFVIARQAKGVYQYKNTKEKLHRTNAAVWYNKLCWQLQLTPKYRTYTKEWCGFNSEHY
jgi:hypothetical protein